MMKILRLEKDKKKEENIIKDVRNRFRMRKEINDNIANDIRNRFRQ